MDHIEHAGGLYREVQHEVPRTLHLVPSYPYPVCKVLLYCCTVVLLYFVLENSARSPQGSTKVVRYNLYRKGKTWVGGDPKAGNEYRASILMLILHFHSSMAITTTSYVRSMDRAFI